MGSDIGTRSETARTVAGLASGAAARFGEATAIRHRSGDGWRQRTFAEVGGVVEELALGLVALGVAPGDRVGLLANTRPEWTYASLAISAAGAVVVPIYPTNAPEECEWVIGNSGARFVVCEDAGQLAKVEQVRGALPELQATVGIEAGGGDLSLDELAARGRDAGDRDELRRRQEAVAPEDAYTFVYTSGTTGPPKGCVLTHRNAMSVGAMTEELGFINEGDVSYLYLPLAHVFALTVQLASFDQGTSIVFFGGDTKQVIAELSETHPTYVPSVPRIFEKLHAMATGAAAKAGPEERERFDAAVRLGLDVRGRRERGEEVPEEMEPAFATADEQIFAKVRALFGGRVRQAVSGAAPISPDILAFFAACGVPVLEGWGMTETTGVGTVNTLDAYRIGTVGRPLPGVEIRIAEDDGEVLVRGPNVFREYWRNPEATADTFTEDGWLRTGDVGEVDADGFLRITGRKKDIIITAGGKNLTPANIENDLKSSRFISQAVMHGDRRPYPVALITLDEEEIRPWAAERGLPDDVAALAGHEDVRALVQAELDRANARYAQVEQVKKFVILDHDLDQARGELTPTLKVKRNVINETYAELFEGMYR